MNKIPICPYCGKTAVLVSGTHIYPHRRDLYALRFWACDPCSAYVGCHKAGAWMYVGGEKILSNGTLPLGRLANAALRREKSAAHAAFDPLWKTGRMRRREAYSWLAKQLGIRFDDCHIGEFDVERCRAVVAAVNGLRAAA